MAPITIKKAILDTLEDIDDDNFKKFCHRLLDCNADRPIRRKRVDNKTRIEIGELLISHFTEPKALDVTLDLLRDINCNQEANDLESSTRACMDKGNPTFRKSSDGRLDINPSQGARTFLATHQSLGSVQGSGPPMKTPDEVKAEAKARVRSEGGDPSNEHLILSRFTIQFGKYKDQTFKWLLENDVSYVFYLLDDHTKSSRTPHTANKESLALYANSYPEFQKEFRLYRENKKPPQSGRAGDALVGFGRFQSETLKGLYESTDRDKISYVEFLRSKKSTCTPKSKMALAVKYILKRDKKKTNKLKHTRNSLPSGSRKGKKKRNTPRL